VDLPFINVSESLTINEDSRTIIRSQATRNFYQREKLGHKREVFHRPGPGRTGTQHRFRLMAQTVAVDADAGALSTSRDGQKKRARVRDGFAKSSTLDNVASRNLRPVQGTEEPVEVDGNVLPDLSRSGRLKYSPASGRVDPFDSLCIPSSPSIQYLLYHREFPSDSSELRLLF
jgi:hypothetical protein